MTIRSPFWRGPAGSSLFLGGTRPTPMAYLTSFKHDVFVSYARLDNEPAIEAGGRLWGWVDLLVDKLARELKQRLGTRSVDFWMDHHQIDGNRPLTPEIMTAIQQSGTLLVVMSPGYVNSEWCQRERHAFLTLVKDRVAQGSVFMVRARKVESTLLPDEFSDLLGFPFSTDDPEVGAERPLGIPDPNEKAFVQKIFNLSHQLSEQLNRLRSPSATPKPSRANRSTSKPKVNVYVASSTEDLEEREDELKAYLDQAGYAVLPAVRYPQAKLVEFEAAMLRDLAQCSAFVQLLSASRGRELDFAPGKRLPILQHEIATGAGVRRLQWRDRGLDVESIRDTEHRALLDAARACGIEEFKRTVVEATSSPPPTTQGQERPAQGLAVFLNSDAPDRLLAKRVGEAFAQIGVDCFYPLTQGKPDDIRRDLESRLLDCDGLVIVYGDTGPQWIRAQLMQSRKILSLRDRPLAALAILEGPPPEKQELAVTSARLDLLDCRKGIDLGVLRGFVQQLNS